MRTFTRRGFLGVAAGGLLVACGSGSTAASGSSGASGGKAAALISYFPDGIYVAGRAERLPFGLADADQVPLSDGPAALEATVVGDDGKTVASVTAPRRVDGLPRAYYPVTLTIATPGVYTLKTKVGGKDLESAFSIVAPKTLSFPGSGDPMPAFDTPTVSDPRGVNPLCTRPEPCPFHDLTLTEALKASKPVAYLVGTPAHCQTGICGPVLDVLMAASKDFAGVTYVHAEVYSDPDAKNVAPAVKALGVDFEPMLFLIGADGVVRQRIDVIYDRGEIHDALAALTA